MNRKSVQEIASCEPWSTGCRLLLSEEDSAVVQGYPFLLGLWGLTARLALAGDEEPAADQESGGPERTERKRRHRILIIEDDPASLQLYSYLLRNFGYQTIAAVDGVDGLAAARREQPDLIICDIQLPGLGGVELMRQLKADPFLRRIPIIAVTAYAMVGDRERLLKAGFDSYIAKPIAPETFVEQIKNFFDQVKGFLH